MYFEVLTKPAFEYFSVLLIMAQQDTLLHETNNLDKSISYSEFPLFKNQLHNDLPASEDSTCYDSYHPRSLSVFFEDEKLKEKITKCHSIKNLDELIENYQHELHCFKKIENAKEFGMFRD